MDNTVDDTNMNDAITKITSLFQKYNDNPYITTKLSNHINNQIESMLESLNIAHQERKVKKTCLNEIKQSFINLFMNENLYYYIPSSECFVIYNSNNYSICNEDDIQYQILTSISKQKHLSPFKHQLKNNIIKQIKLRTLYTSTPDTITIQSVLDILYPLCFPTKNDAKYFLTILGDNILKKNDNINHFIKPSCKQFFHILNQYIYTYLGSSTPTVSFKSKYQDHIYQNCRIVQTSNTIKNIDNYQYQYQSLFKTNALNLICVACHYSNRYKSSDNFIRNICNDQSISNQAFYIYNNTPESICDLFINKTIEYTNNTIHDNTTCISWKNMLFLWKIFIKQQSIPNILFSTHLKSLLIKKHECNYNAETDMFVNMTSQHIPIVKLFTTFWNEQILFDDNEYNEYDLEIDEFTTLFRKWINNTCKSPICEKLILDLIKHFYNDVCIEDNKYIVNVKCKLWDKIDDIHTFLTNIKIQYVNSNRTIPISISELYDYYCKLSQNNQYIVSKRYFDKYINDTLHEYIDTYTISTNWWIN